jgi:hypothetical protein
LGLEKPNSGLDPDETNSGSDLDSDETFQISRNLGLDIDERSFVFSIHSFVYSTYATMHAATYACYYIFSPNKLRLIERESTILSSVSSNRAFNPGAATGIPVSTESLVLEGTQK